MIREHVVSMATSLFKDINKINEKDQHIRQGFDICRLNLYSNNTIILERYLTLLSKNKIYRALIYKNFERDID